jgi:hypothetical protein
MIQLFKDDGSDHNHPLIDDGTDWRGGNDLKSIGRRFASYGEYAGYSNRMEVENEKDIQAKRAADPNYDPYNDDAYKDKYKPVDAIDAAARDHDHSYFQKLGMNNPLTGEKEHSMDDWEGMNRVAAADGKLAKDIKDEMDAHGDNYSDLTRTKAEGLEGYFGSRARGVEAVDWAGNKAGEAEAGVTDFADKLSHAQSLSEVGNDVSQGISDAGSWLANAGKQALGGLGEAAADFERLGAFGKANTIAGYGTVAWQGLKHLVGADDDGSKEGASAPAANDNAPAAAATPAIDANAPITGAGATPAALGIHDDATPYGEMYNA